MNSLGYVVALTFDTCDPAEARALGFQIVRSLDGLMPKLVLASTMVHPEGRPSGMNWVVCSKFLGMNRRCYLPFGHSGDHHPEWPTEGFSG